MRAKIKICELLVFSGMLIFWTESVSAQGYGVNLFVSPDEEVLEFAQTIRVSAHFSNSYIPVTVSDAAITLNGITQPAVIENSSGWVAYADFNVANIDRTTEMFASATVDEILITPGVLPGFTTIHHSSEAPPASYLAGTSFGGMGRKSDFILGPPRLKSLAVNGGYPICFDETNSISLPQIRYEYSAANSVTNAWPILYKTGAVAQFEFTTYPADTGVKIVMLANPKAARQMGSGSITLYDNTGTTNYLIFTAGVLLLNATNSLDAHIESYNLRIQNLLLGVEFSLTHTVTFPTSTDGGTPTIVTALGNPQSPMATPWYEVILDADSWAFGATNAASGKSALVDKFYRNAKYNGGSSAWTRLGASIITNTTVPVEVFYPLEFKSSGHIGQCTDFSDYLACMIGCISAGSADRIEIRNSVSGSTINTVALLSSPDLPPTATSAYSWNFHQVTTVGNVFDSCVRPGGTTIIDNMTSAAWITNTFVPGSYSVHSAAGLQLRGSYP